MISDFKFYFDYLAEYWDNDKVQDEYVDKFIYGLVGTDFRQYYQNKTGICVRKLMSTFKKEDIHMKYGITIVEKFVEEVANRKS